MLQVYKAIFVVLLEQITIFSLVWCSHCLLSYHWWLKMTVHITIIPFPQELVSTG